MASTPFAPSLYVVVRTTLCIDDAAPTVSEFWVWIKYFGKILGKILEILILYCNFAASTPIILAFCNRIYFHN